MAEYHAGKLQEYKSEQGLDQSKTISIFKKDSKTLKATKTSKNRYKSKEQENIPYLLNKTF